MQVREGVNTCKRGYLCIRGSALCQEKVYTKKVCV